MALRIFLKLSMKLEYRKDQKITNPISSQKFFILGEILQNYDFFNLFPKLLFTNVLVFPMKKEHHNVPFDSTKPSRFGKTSGPSAQV